MSFKPSSSSSYHLISSSEAKAEEAEELHGGPPGKTQQTPSSNSRITTIICFITMACTLLLLGFTGGIVFEQVRSSHPLESSSSSAAADAANALGLITHGKAVPTADIGLMTTHFELDQAFAAVPNETNEAERVWDSLLPNGLGYVKVEEITGKKLSVVSVFHQLHCLYTLRRAYYSDRRGGHQHQQLQDFDFGLDRHDHTTHCFEYLRQSLMCSADSSVEPAETGAEAGVGFLGWGFERQCRNYDALKTWSEKHRAFDAHGFLAKDLHKNHDS